MCSKTLFLLARDIMPSAVAIPERFGFFDPQAEYAVTYGKLPHWEQEGATQFITFRTADSIPRSVMDLWRAERGCLADLREYARSARSRMGLGVCAIVLLYAPCVASPEFTAKLERHLDDLHGACSLAWPGIAEIVADSLRHFDGARYHLGDFVVMPNHVHLIACTTRGFSMRAQCQSWKHFTARRINQNLGQTGQFWQTESFDHLIRDHEHFARFQRYIRKNAEEARSAGSRFLHWAVPGE